MISTFAPAAGEIPFLESPQQCVAVYHYDQLKDGSRCHSIPKTRECEGSGGGLKGIQRFLKNVLNTINKIKSIAGTFLGTVSDLANAIKSIINDAVLFITNLVKTLIDKIRGYITNKFNNAIKDLFNLLPPNLRPGLNEASEKGTDIIQCVFNKIISGLFDLVSKLLNDIIDKYINAPLCAVENFVGQLLGNVLSEITGAIDGALGLITGLVGKAVGFLDKVFNALDIVSGIIKFLLCEESPDCSMVEDWSLWHGAKCVTEEISEKSKGKIQEIAESVNKTLAGITSSIGAADAPPCNTGQLPCGPPSLVVDGFGKGFGAAGNPIVSPSGSILAVDLISGGSGYQFPNAKIVDTCGNGNGVIAIPKLSSVIIPFSNGATEDGKEGGASIEEIIIVEPGVGFLPAPDGSTGANQETYSNPDESIYEDNEGNKKVVKCKKTIPVFVGNKLYLPQATTTEVYDPEGNVVQTLNGLGQITPIKITANGKVTIPCESRANVGGGISTIQYPNSSDGTYPVALGINTVFVTNPGTGYTSGDTITVTPDNGASLEPIFTGGQLTGVNVVKSGIGFTEFPRIIVNSTTGFNANMVPVFKIIRANERPDEIPLGTPLIEVIDCVGRVL